MSKKNTRTKKAVKKSSSKKNEKVVNPIVSEIIFAIILLLAIFIALSLFGLCGIVGKTVSSLLFGLFGVIAYLFPVFMIVVCCMLISNRNNSMGIRKSWYGLGMYLSLCGLVQWFFNSDVKNVWETYSHAAEYHTRGGFFGGLLSYELSKLLGRAGDMILLIGLFLLFFILFSRKLIFTSLRDKAAKKNEERKERKSSKNTYIYDTDDDLQREKMQVPTLDPGMRKAAKAHAEKKAVQNQPNTDQALAPKLNNEEGADKKKEKRLGRKKEMKKTAEMEQVTPALPETEEEKILKNVHINGLNRETTDSNIAEKELEAKFGKKSSDSTTDKPVEPVSNPVDVGAAATATAAGSVSTKAESSTQSDSYIVSNKSKNVNKADESDIEKIDEEIKKEAEVKKPYVFPSVDLLSRPKSGGKTTSEKELQNTAIKLKETLESFGVGVTLGDISVGPSVTRYELVPDQGVKVSRITSLSDDIKLALAASDIRIEAPIPGKSAVGIEVPNSNRVTIMLRELLESDEFNKAKSKVTFAVGKDISGKTVVTDIAKLPHLLVAGSTGSGKSVLINTLIMSIIYKASPDEVKLIMVDPKMVEFMAYQDIPHLMIPVVEDPKKASAALAWAVVEMENRYKKFAELRMRDIASYNAKVSKMKNTDEEHKVMPQIVIIVDEFADLMMVASSDVEASVCRLAQKARAAGIHLVLATQRPSVNVITGLIKANIPSRIALSVSSQIDSRTIIDSAGAEKLLGNGDMLFAPQTLPEPIRVQGAFVSDDDRDKVVSFLKSSGGPAYDDEVTKTIETVQSQSESGGSAEAPKNGDDRDDYFEEAGRFIIEKQKASIGNLQRVFRIGFNRAARIMDQLADAGVVGPEEGTKARTILMTKEQFEAFLSGGDVSEEE